MVLARRAALLAVVVVVGVGLGALVANAQKSTFVCESGGLLQQALNATDAESGADSAQEAVRASMDVASASHGLTADSMAIEHYVSGEGEHGEHVEKYAVRDQRGALGAIYSVHETSSGRFLTHEALFCFNGDGELRTPELVEQWTGDVEEDVVKDETAGVSE